MDIGADFLLALNEIMSMSSGSLSGLTGNTPVTCSVYKSYSSGIRYDITENNYKKFYMDLSVIAKTSDISTLNLTPRISKIWLDGVPYLIGNLITYVGSTYTWLELKAYTNTA